MDLRGKVNVSSSWKESASLQSVLNINICPDELDQPLYEGEEVMVNLSQPSASQENFLPCFLHITQLTALRGYSVIALEFRSGSRTVEVYQGEDYIATCKGSAVGQSSQESLMFEWHLDMASNEHHSYDSLTLKLLSLHGRAAVDIGRLTLVLSGHGGKVPALMCEKSEAHLQPLQEMLDFLPTITANTPPPFLSSLVCSLKFCQANKAAVTAPSESSLELLPPEIAHMVSAFQAMRPPVAELPIPAQKDNYGQCREGIEDQKNVKVNLMESHPDHCCNAATLTLADVEYLMDERMRELEIRMTNYVDAKFNEMMSWLVKGSKSRRLGDCEQ